MVKREKLAGRIPIINDFFINIYIIFLLSIYIIINNNHYLIHILTKDKKDISKKEILLIQ